MCETMTGTAKELEVGDVLVGISQLKRAPDVVDVAAGADVDTTSLAEPRGVAYDHLANGQGRTEKLLYALAAHAERGTNLSITLPPQVEIEHLDRPIRGLASVHVLTHGARLQCQHDSVNSEVKTILEDAA